MELGFGVYYTITYKKDPPQKKTKKRIGNYSGPDIKVEEAGPKVSIIS